MVDVWLPTTDGRWLVMPRHTHPDEDQQIVLDLLAMTLPAQPPPRIKTRSVPTQLPLPLPTTDEATPV